MFYIYRTISDFYYNQLAKELDRNNSSTLATVLNTKATYWFSKMIHAKGAL